MGIRPRRIYSPAFKAKVTAAAIKGERTLIELAQDFDVYPNQIKPWHDQLLEGATGVFGEASKSEPEPAIDVKTLHAKIGELTLENDLFVRGARQSGFVAERKKLIDPTTTLSVRRQAVVLGISRGSICCQPRPVSDADPKRMHRIRCPAIVCLQTMKGDKLHMEFPPCGQPDAAGAADPRRVQGGAAARCHANEAHGH